VVACSQQHLALHLQPASSSPSPPLHLQTQAASHLPPSCLPYTISFQKGVGRCLVASRTVLPGELVLAESPIVVGPNQRTQPLCLGCLQPTDLSCLCPVCKFPFCRPECLQNAQETHSRECEVLAKCGGQVDFGDEGGSGWAQLVLPLRLLLFYKDQPKNAALVKRLMTHTEEKVGREYWPLSQKHVVDFLTNECKETRWSVQEITEAVCLLEVNGFEIESFSAGTAGGFRGLYPYIAALTSHSCKPNCLSVVDSQPPYTNRLIASRRVEVGEELTTTYIPLTLSTATRRNLLKQGWCFSCCCPRCSDPTELGAHSSTLTCRQCKGFLLPDTCLEASSTWSCKCGKSMKADEVDRLVTCFMDTVGKQAEEKRYNLAGWTQLLKCASPIFHPQHQVICEIARWLLPIMGRSGHQDTPTLQQKHQLATSYLLLLDRVLGELSKTRAKAIFELVDCGLVLAIREFEEDAIDAASLKNKLTGNANKIADALHIFEVVGVETNFEKMMQISLRKMQSQSESMIQQLWEEGFQ